MPLTVSLRGAILQTLSQSFGKDSDWRIHDSEDASSTRTNVIITYAYDDSFQFLARIPKAKGRTQNSAKQNEFEILIEYIPGEATAQEEATVYGTNAMLIAVAEWTRRIHDELNTGPIADAVREQQAQIDELVRRMGDLEAIGESVFTKDEAEVFQERITNLEADLAASIERQHLSEKEHKEALELLAREMQELRSATTLKKKKHVLRKVASWLVTASTPALAKALGTEIAHRLLLP